MSLQMHYHKFPQRSPADWGRNARAIDVIQLHQNISAAPGSPIRLQVLWTAMQSDATLALLSMAGQN